MDVLLLVYALLKNCWLSLLLCKEMYYQGETWVLKYYLLETFLEDSLVAPKSFATPLSFQLNGFPELRNKGHTLHFSLIVIFLSLLVWGHLQRRVIYFLDVLEHKKKRYVCYMIFYIRNNAVSTTSK